MPAVQQNTNKLLGILRRKESYGVSVPWNEKECSEVISIVGSGIDTSNPELLEGAFVSSFCEPLAAWLLAQGADINTSIKSYRDAPTFLHLACAEARQDAVMFLVENGADVNAEDKAGMRPISFIVWAMQSGDEDARRRATALKKYLEERGAVETVQSRTQMNKVKCELEGGAERDCDYRTRLGAETTLGDQTGNLGSRAVTSIKDYRNRNKEEGPGRAP